VTPGPAGGFVDYERAAAVYGRGRALSGASLARWRDAVRGRLPDGPLRRVGDVGAGTGVFIPMWLELGAEEIVAVEPSAAMRASARAGLSERVRMLAGSASELPIASASADALWLSAVHHHVPDLDAAAAEWRRVLRPGGRAFFRGFFPDTSAVAWLDFMPGAARARARFPTTARLAAVLRPAGLGVVDVVDVPEPEGPRAHEAADWIARMRHADSLLTALRDDEITSGLAALRALGEARLEPLRLTLVTAVSAPGG
jgi:SAM-dependent methyltransferase